MCGVDIKAEVRLGKAQEKKNPQGAAKHYLVAAQELIHKGEHEPDKVQKYTELAGVLFKKAQALQRQRLTSPIVSLQHNSSSFSDIGGLEDMKEELHLKIIQPLLHPDVFTYYGKSIGGGILMYGPPGCGKSLIAQATAKEAQASFIHVKSSDLKSKFVGETEKNIAALFDKARKAQPTIIFFDEFEAMGGDRSENDVYNKSAVSQLLVEMDGMDAKGQKILLLAATNEPWSIDPALRREGRFGSTVYVPAPDKKARAHIFHMLMLKRPTTILDYDLLAAQTEGFSGADIKSVCERATDIPLKESFQTKKQRGVTMDDMETAISSTQSVLKQWFAKAQKQVEERKLEDVFPLLIKK